MSPFYQGSHCREVQTLQFQMSSIERCPLLRDFRRERCHCIAVFPYSFHTFSAIVGVWTFHGSPKRSALDAPSVHLWRVQARAVNWSNWMNFCKNSAYCWTILLNLLIQIYSGCTELSERYMPDVGGDFVDFSILRLWIWPEMIFGRLITVKYGNGFIHLTVFGFILDQTANSDGYIISRFYQTLFSFF